jgi:hypothetical protein
VARKPEITTERVTIIVRPSAAHPDILSVQDAMKQVLDFFELLTPDEQPDNNLVWNLRVATTNSPLTVEGEAVSLVPDIDVTVIARAQKVFLAESLRAITTGAKPARALSKRKRNTIQRMMKRNTNGIGETEAIFVASEPPLVVTPIIALESIKMLEAEEGELKSFLPADREREEIGSIEALLLDVGTEYNQPAIHVRERKTGKEIWCRVSQDLQGKISREASFEDVWEHRRVIVRGRIQYDADGEIIRVYATAVSPLKPRTMTVHDIKDADFTSGEDTLSYLEKLREGELG